MRLNRRKHVELNEEARRRANARSKLHVYVKRGSVVKATCEVCGSVEVQGHHDDYSKPLEVHWLCRQHHLERENKTMRKQTVEKY